MAVYQIGDSLWQKHSSKTTAGWSAGESAFLNVLIESYPDKSEELQLLHQEVLDGKSLIQATAGIKPFTPSCDIEKPYMVALRSIEGVPVKFLTFDADKGLGFTVKSGLHFDGVQMLDEGMALTLLMDLKRNMPEKAQMLCLYHAYSGEEVHFSPFQT